MIASRLNDIVSYFHHPITNGPQEGMNAKLMSVIRAGRGYRHHDTFRKAELFFLGNLDMFPRHEAIRAIPTAFPEEPKFKVNSLPIPNFPASRALA